MVDGQNCVEVIRDFEVRGAEEMDVRAGLA